MLFATPFFLGTLNMNVIVTGGSGFLGSFVVERLKEYYAGRLGSILVPRSKDYDLVNIDDVNKLYNDASPDIVIHLAARVGAIVTGKQIGRAHV